MESKELLKLLTAQHSALRTLRDKREKLDELREHCEEARETVVGHLEAITVDSLTENEDLQLDTDDEVSIVELFGKRPKKLTGELLAEKLLPSDLFDGFNAYASKVNAWRKGVSAVEEATEAVLEAGLAIDAHAETFGDDKDWALDALFNAGWGVSTDAYEAFSAADNLPEAKPINATSLDEALSETGE